jgi:hypothetical protein
MMVFLYLYEKKVEREKIVKFFTRKGFAFRTSNSSVKSKRCQCNFLFAYRERYQHRWDIALVTKTCFSGKNYYGVLPRQCSMMWFVYSYTRYISGEWWCFMVECLRRMVRIKRRTKCEQHLAEETSLACPKSKVGASAPVLLCLLYCKVKNK